MSVLRRFRGLLVELLQALWFVPALIVVSPARSPLPWSRSTGTRVGGGPLFQGDASAARTVLSVISGSLITVAGLTFSITIVVLQLISSQFSPRILRTFFGDRLTQITAGSYVGIFVYSILLSGRSADSSCLASASRSPRCWQSRRWCC